MDEPQRFLDETMSGITLVQAQANLDALLAVQAGTMASVSIGGRSYTSRSATDLIALINFWSRQVASLERAASGQSRHGYSLANLSRIQ